MQQRLPLRNAQNEVSFAEYLKACLKRPDYESQTKRSLASVNNLSRIFDNVPLDDQYFARPLAFRRIKKQLETIMKELKKETDDLKVDTLEKLAQYVPSEKIQTKLAQCLNAAIVLSCREVLDSKCKNLRGDILTVLRDLGLNEAADGDPNIDAKIKSQIVSSYFNMYLLSSLMNNFFVSHHMEVKNPLERQKYESAIQRSAQALSRSPEFFSQTLQEETLKITRATGYVISYLNNQGHERSDEDLQKLLEQYPEFKETGFAAKYAGWIMHFKSYPDIDNVLRYVGENFPELAKEMIRDIKATFSKTFPVQMEMKEEHRNGILGGAQMNDAATFGCALRLLAKLGKESTVKRLISSVLGGSDNALNDKNIDLVFRRLCEKEYGVTNTPSPVSKK
jgi:tetratricopeptide (TPR) repeat protein